MTNPVHEGASSAGLPALHLSDLQKFSRCLREHGLLDALRFLNARTSHRYTGVFRFDGDMLRSVALVDRWKAVATKGDDGPLAQAYCAHLERTGEALVVVHGPTDPRVPWMSDSPILSYCGAVINAPDGSRWGALCHYDMLRCESSESEVPLLDAAADLLYEQAANAVR